MKVAYTIIGVLIALIVAYVALYYTVTNHSGNGARYFRAFPAYLPFRIWQPMAYLESKFRGIPVYLHDGAGNGEMVDANP
jgi:hypothetical protein